ncbi:rRNA maturation RNase YbeY [Granulicella mallensis]|uniref:Endoribonuclease YbeY n=1 Tax=Granulicella mallensis (strain ATCC BAA-1857 / DSM 23137 / MP5ACTX8) TaxID=682795 RepID=G8NZD3_GRAMM|nr:rRNA maturation RNase YbeY [Granulicella mallensis]AEU37961.1 protein of unknown function UPF0054 [Granulicella mallensis MP5ACTX8]
MITLEPPRRLEASADPWGELGLSRAGLGRFVRTAQAAVGLRGEVEVLLSDDRTLRRLNREFRGKDKATDVLSFPAPPELEGQLAGDLAISLDTALKQAQEQGHTLRDEVRVLLLHGLLHLYGMDHEVDEGEMAAREAVLRTQLRLRNGLIARVEAGPGLWGRGEKQIPSGNDNKKSKGKSKGKKASAKKVSA